MLKTFLGESLIYSHFIQKFIFHEKHTELKCYNCASFWPLCCREFSLLCVWTLHLIPIRLIHLHWKWGPPPQKYGHFPIETAFFWTCNICIENAVKATEALEMHCILMKYLAMYVFNIFDPFIVVWLSRLVLHLLRVESISSHMFFKARYLSWRSLTLKAFRMLGHSSLVHSAMFKR